MTRMGYMGQHRVRENLRVWVYNGGMWDNNGDLPPFKKGVLYLAMHSWCHSSLWCISPSTALDHVSTSGTVQAEVLDATPTRGLTVADMPKLMDTGHRAMRTTFFHMSETPQENRAIVGPVPRPSSGQGQRLGRTWLVNGERDHTPSPPRCQN